MREGRPKESGQPTLAFESRSKEQTIGQRGKRGDAGPRFIIKGVRISTAITHRNLDVRVKQEDARALVIVNSGEVRLVDKKGQKARIEAGQQAVLTAGQVIGPKSPSDAALTIEKAGSLRVFSASRRVPVTLKWSRPEGAKGVLVEVSPSRTFRRPLFSDVIERSSLTVEVPRASIYWRVRPVDEAGKTGDQAISGRLALVPDTSYQALKDARPPRNVIDESFGNTTVFYQNALPSFSFRWKPIAGASRYTFKLFREGKLSAPLRSAETRRVDLTLASGQVGEGAYLWYVAARDSAGELIKTTKSRRLRIRYDNATPNLQIVYPRNELVVADEHIVVRGVAIPGSKVFINGKAVELDDTQRFNHPTPLKRGPNDIIFRVVDNRGGSSLYLRRVVRR